MTTSEKPLYQITPEAALAQLQSRREGLTAVELGERQTQYGPNLLAVKRKESPLVTYLRQFKDLMILLLVASSAISLYLQDSRTAIVLLALVFFNTTIGFFQEFKAEKVM